MVTTVGYRCADDDAIKSCGSVELKLLSFLIFALMDMNVDLDAPVALNSQKFFNSILMRYDEFETINRVENFFISFCTKLTRRTHNAESSH
jgi:hypothetical protein